LQIESYPVDGLSEILVAVAILNVGRNNRRALRRGFAKTPKVALNLRRNVIAPYFELRQELMACAFGIAKLRLRTRFCARFLAERSSAIQTTQHTTSG
jgi:hypothetical protein